MRKYIGYAMIAAPFIGFGLWAAADMGLLKVALIYAGVIAMVVWLSVATWLTE